MVPSRTWRGVASQLYCPVVALSILFRTPRLLLPIDGGRARAASPVCTMHAGSRVRRDGSDSQDQVRLAGRLLYGYGFRRCSLR